MLLLLATFETTYHKGKRRYAGMFWVVFLTMLVSTLGTTLVGTGPAAGPPPARRPQPRCRGAAACH